MEMQQIRADTKMMRVQYFNIAKVQVINTNILAKKLHARALNLNNQGKLIKWRFNAT